MGYEEKWREHTEKYQKLCVEHDTIPDELFREYGVNRGLRDINGNPATESSGTGATM